MKDLVRVGNAVRFTEWEVLEPMCGEVRGRGHVRCELPPDHDHTDHHFGRARGGRWIGWPAERLPVRIRRRQDRVEAALSPPRSDGLPDPEWVAA